MSCSFLIHLLEEIQNHSTIFGQTWTTVFILFRIVPIAVAGASIYYDDQSHFVCNTEHPSCVSICYKSFAPLSHIKFCVYQIIIVVALAVLYHVYATRKMARTVENDEGDHEEDPMMCSEVAAESVRETKENQSPAKANHDIRRQIGENGLMRIYVVQLLARALLEVAFLVGQYFLYGFQVNPVFMCSRKPCLDRVSCFISRPTEKTVFLLIMYGARCVCLLLNILEMHHLGFGTIRDALNSERKEPVDSGTFN